MLAFFEHGNSVPPGKSYEHHVVSFLMPRGNFCDHINQYLVHSVQFFNVTCLAMWINHCSIYHYFLIAGNGVVGCFHHFSIQPATDHENGVVTTAAGGAVS
jgi:hypothetical protein